MAIMVHGEVIVSIDLDDRGTVYDASGNQIPFTTEANLTTGEVTRLVRPPKTIGGATVHRITEYFEAPLRFVPMEDKPKSQGAI